MKLQNIIHVVCDYYNVSRYNIRDRSKKRYYTRVRQVIFYQAYRVRKKAKELHKKGELEKESLVPFSLEDVAKHFGMKNHCVILTSVKAVEERLQTDLQLYTDIVILNRMIDDMYLYKKNMKLSEIVNYVDRVKADVVRAFQKAHRGQVYDYREKSILVTFKDENNVSD